MTLTRLDSPVPRRRFLVYDLEWIPGSDTRPGHVPMELRLIGVYDGNRYRSYTAIERFLDCELTPRNAGAWIMAHYGGLSDIQYVLDYLIERSDYTIEASFSGSSAIIVSVSKGRYTWTFIDSGWLIRSSLRKIGEWVGEAKGGGNECVECGHESKVNPCPECGHVKEKTDIFYAPLPLLREYNERDCRILYRALTLFESIVVELGGSLERTVASTALALFRRRFLTRDIETSDSVNDIAREAYIASRVENLSRRCGPTRYYDINSSFPRSMLEKQPGKLRRFHPRLVESEECYLASLTISVPDDLAIPPLPWRAERSGRVFFPTGTWQAWLDSADVRLLLEAGGKIEKVHNVAYFEPFDDLAAYAETLYGMRLASNDVAFKVVAKYLLNSLYGKFAERSDKISLMVRPARIDRKTWTMLRPGVWLAPVDRAIPHCHVPISCHITALSRAALTRLMWQAGTVHYVDTDSLTTPAILPTGSGLGELKLEYPSALESPDGIAGAVFAAPKLYRLDKANGEHIVRAKGFSGLDREGFDKLLAGESVSTTRMIRVRENLRSGNTAPTEKTYSKRLLGLTRPKRCHDDKGRTSRPWNVRELEGD